MAFTNWLLDEKAISRDEKGDYLVLSHQGNCKSSLWYQHDVVPSWIKGDLYDFYSQFDGGNFFGSAFIIAAINAPKERNGVTLVFSLNEIGREWAKYEFDLPEPAIAFMYQAGIGIYAVGQQSGVIYECDTETGDVTTYVALQPIFEEWWEAVQDDI